MITNIIILKKVLMRGLYVKEKEAEKIIKVYKYDIGQKYFEIIFSHNFAKAFWTSPDTIEVIGRCHTDSMNKKDGTICGCEDSPYEILMWQYHLQQMVLSEEPLKYLEDFL